MSAASRSVRPDDCVSRWCSLPARSTSWRASRARRSSAAAARTATRRRRRGRARASRRRRSESETMQCERDDVVELVRDVCAAARRYGPSPRRPTRSGALPAQPQRLVAALDAGARLLHLERHLRAERPLASAASAPPPPPSSGRSRSKPCPRTPRTRRGTRARASTRRAASAPPPPRRRHRAVGRAAAAAAAPRPPSRAPSSSTKRGTIPRPSRASPTPCTSCPCPSARRRRRSRCTRWHLRRVRATSSEYSPSCVDDASYARSNEYAFTVSSWLPRRAPRRRRAACGRRPSPRRQGWWSPRRSCPRWSARCPARRLLAAAAGRARRP